MQNNTFSKEFQTMISNIEKTYNASLIGISKFSKLDKRAYKKAKYSVEKELKELDVNILFFNSYDQNNFENKCLSESLSLNIYDNNFNTDLLRPLNLKTLLKDTEFKRFLKNILIMKKSYTPSKRDFISILYKDMCYYFNNIRKIFLSYVLLKDIKLTRINLQNITSYIFKDSIVNLNTISLSNEKEKLFNQIITGVKYEKLKEDINHRGMNEYSDTSKKFNIIEIAKKTIKINYISSQEYIHRFHKSPITHVRKAHYRYYKSGKRVWIKESTIN